MAKYNAIVSRELIALPGGENTISAGRGKSVEAAKLYLENPKDNKRFIFLTQNNPDIEDPTINDVYKICSLIEIVDVVKENKFYKIKFKCLKRMLLLNLKADSIYKVEAESVKESNLDDKNIPIKINEMVKILTKESDQEQKTKLNKILASKTISEVIDKIINIITIDEYVKYKDFRKTILSELNLSERINLAFNFVQNNKTPLKDDEKIQDEKNRAAIDNEINKKVNDSLSKNQREFYLREKLKIVKDEIAKINPSESEAAGYRKRVEENPYPQNIKDKVLNEVSKLETSSNYSQENAVTKQYIDWLLNIPWWQETKDNNDMEYAKKILDESHFGLEKIKERIIEYLAVRARAPKGKSPIICLAGPPGVGKTSLAKSIAEALNKKFVKISLGGVDDESEIRGHRKTYLGSMPGRIIKGLKQAGVINPMFLLDEIDKMGRTSVRGDPASALLEVLDPEQNTMYSDNYIEENYDLSRVMFICTANYVDQIPAPLYDRLEIIELTSYTEKEKLSIAKSYLIDKVLTNSGITSQQLSFNDETLLFIIRHYTREAGVRELERVLQKISRKVVVKIQKNEKYVEKIDTSVKVKEYLKKIVYDYNMKDDKVLSGVVNGMAYTTAGGDLLPIEVTFFKGKGTISITGNLKETMKESAQVALGYVKAHASEFGVGEVNFGEIDLHIHVPSGGIPKDGPSAGVTLTTAIISALSKRIVPNNIAMTGEITLRGKVGIIGGVREKVISAFRGGVTEIFMPKDDERFLDEIPNEIRDNIEIHLIDTYDQIYHSIFER